METSSKASLSLVSVSFNWFNFPAGRALFYWFFEAAEDPDSKPLLLWLNGGPGCSSIAYGLAEEIGPFHIRPDGKTLYLNPYSWNLAANILFIDSPVGVDFSYSNTSSDLLNNGDKRTGHYVPQLSQTIVRYNKATKAKAINLKGYMVGNALTDDYHHYFGLFQFFWSVGLISDETYKLSNILCDYKSLIHSPYSCIEVLGIAVEEMGNIDTYSIYTPPCSANASQAKWLLRRRLMVGQLGEKYDPCTAKHTEAYFNLPEVQKSLHVLPGAAPSKWETCSETVNRYWKDSPRTVLDVYEELIHEGLRIWIFSGDTDAAIPITSTRYTIDALKLPTVSPWRAWYDDGQVGGRTQEFEGLNFVSVRGAGHEVPKHRPKQALTLIKAFLAGTSMPAAASASQQLISDS
ncbi:hypothetical protein V6N13_000451 [Hibiscus sabdariffa]